ncbi:hypothetical protein P8452_24066 [Trifolium repens]|nr:hypothetical protein P8452_24066 [Trifolium repens]
MKIFTCLDVSLREYLSMLRVKSTGGESYWCSLVEEDETEQLKASVDYLVELCETVSPLAAVVASWFLPVSVTVLAFLECSSWAVFFVIVGAELWNEIHLPEAFKKAWFNELNHDDCGWLETEEEANRLKVTFLPNEQHPNFNPSSSNTPTTKFNGQPSNQVIGASTFNPAINNINSLDFNFYGEYTWEKIVTTAQASKMKNQTLVFLATPQLVR